MSYIDRLDILLEAEGPSRRDFNKSVAGAVASSNFIPNMAGVANMASTGATAAVSSLGKILTALDSYYSSNTKDRNSVYLMLGKLGKDKLLKTKEFLNHNPNINYDDALEIDPLTSYFCYDYDEDFFCRMDDHGPNKSNVNDPDGVFIDYGLFNSTLEHGIFNKLYLNNEDPFFSLDWMNELNGDLLKHVSGKFGGFKNFFSTLADAMEEEGSVNLAERLAGVLRAVEENAPSLYRSLGLKVNPSEIVNNKQKKWDSLYSKNARDYNGAEDSASINADYGIEKLESDFLGQLREKGLVSDKFDEYVELHKDSVSRIKAKVDKQGRIDKLKETEERIKAPRREKKFDDEAMNRWEDEGGALGTLDEAIWRLLNVIY